MEKATFAAGCFWGIEYKFSKLPGVVATAVGYEGGQVQQPTYKQVCTDRTGHAEVVQVEFDPSKITFEKLVHAFYGMHDPTTLNRQGPDYGSQYRSAIFYHSPAQKTAAETITAELNQSTFKNAIVTQIVPTATFWPAEEYHQKYAEKHGSHCAF